MKDRAGEDCGFTAEIPHGRAPYENTPRSAARPSADGRKERAFAPGSFDPVESRWAEAASADGEVLLAALSKHLVPSAGVRP
jgi:hypothetical protein